MIIIDEDDHNSKTTQARRLPLDEETSESSQLISGPPPSYSASTSYGTVYNAPLQYPDDLPAHPRHERLVRRGENARRRFFTAFTVAICLWLLFTLLIQSIAESDLLPVPRNNGTKGSDKITSPRKPNRENAPWDGRIRFPICVSSPHENATRNGSSPDAPYSVKLGFSLPVTSDLAFSTDDSYAIGLLSVDTFETEGSEVEVDVETRYNRHPEALQRSKVCLFENGSERLLRIMTNQGVSTNSGFLRYDVYVRLPVSSHNKAPVYISRLEANLSMFTVDIGDLAGRVQFGDFDLKTRYEIIDVLSLSAHKARLRTAQSSIKGNYTISNSLELVTENAPIDVNVNMHNSASSPDDPPTHLELRTKNSVVSARLNLSNPSTTLSPSLVSPHLLESGSIGGNFSINSITSNAELELDVLSQPYSSFLSLHAQTSNSAIRAYLPPQISGNFAVATSIFQPEVKVDPKRWHERGRRRQVEISRSSKNAVKGNIAWFDGRGRREQGGGIVDVRTSLFPAVLAL